MIVKYNSNNSGGSWWLEDEDWLKLEKAGWKVDWVDSDPSMFRFADRPGKDGKRRWLGALARNAEKEFESPGDAMREFEKITKKDVSDEGCNCCGAPHSFSWGEGKNSGYASGEGCLEYLFEGKKIPKNLREAMEGND